ncbi:type IV conjugative transfer system protein TraE [Thauera aminoaromatica]|jgi:conjugal transfer pilus assembly protein TraE|uniref:Type IV conjugative transfer system protein TraE n=1 Tax=Thauera aminoaromatica TaxID=164330 RepID=A0A5C7TBE2_THASP|nr:type IV conjugative transfer system protein TraE [Thauera aminoaromatica]TXH92271.1 MAG: type IV conjugative transfer system protein TraE [Thauera aminoaromatica]
MDAKKLSYELEVKAGFSRVFQGVLALSLATNLALAVAYATSEKTIRTVHVPPQIEKTFWVEGSRVSVEYLEGMGIFIAGLLLNTTPSTVEYQLQTALKYMDPRNFAELQRRLTSSAENVKKEGISSYFTYVRVRVDEKTQRVVLTGNLEVWIGGKRISERRAAYLLAFQTLDGRITLTDFRETNENDPFAPLQDTASQ